jgi:hypothetical protein
MTVDDATLERMARAHDRERAAVEAMEKSA